MPPILYIIAASLLLTAMIQPKEDKRMAAIPTIFRHFHRILLLFKHRLENLAIDAVPLMQTLAEDTPEIASQVYSVMNTTAEIYNSERFGYLEDDFKNLFFVFLKPIMSADDQCVVSANNQVVSMLKPTESAFAASIRDRFIKVEKLMREAREMFNIVLDMIMDITEAAIEQGKKCSAIKRSTAMIECLHDALIPWGNNLDALPEDPDFSDFMAKMRELTGEILSAGGNVTGALESLLKDVWMAFMMCVDQRRQKKHFRNRQAFPMTLWKYFPIG